MSGAKEQQNARRKHTTLQVLHTQVPPTQASAEDSAQCIVLSRTISMVKNFPVDLLVSIKVIHAHLQDRHLLKKINYLKRECNRVNSFTSDLQLINVFINVRNRQVVTNEEDLVRSNEIV